MKNQALFSSEDKSKKLKCRPLQVLFGALRVNKTLFLEERQCAFIRAGALMRIDMVPGKTIKKRK